MPWVVAANANGQLEIHWQMPNGERPYGLQPKYEQTYLPVAMLALQGIIWKHSAVLRAVEYVREKEIADGNANVLADSSATDVVAHAEFEDVLGSLGWEEDDDDYDDRKNALRTQLQADVEKFNAELRGFIGKFKQNLPLSGYDLAALFGDAAGLSQLIKEVIPQAANIAARDAKQESAIIWGLRTPEERIQAYKGSIEAQISNGGVISFAPSAKAAKWTNPATKGNENLPSVISDFAAQVLNKHAAFLGEVLGTLWNGCVNGNAQHIAADVFMQGKLADEMQKVLAGFPAAAEKEYVRVGLESFLADIKAFKAQPGNASEAGNGTLELIDAMVHTAQQSIADHYWRVADKTPFVAALKAHAAEHAKQTAWDSKTPDQKVQAFAKSLKVTVDDAGFVIAPKKSARPGVPAVVKAFNDQVLQKHAVFLAELVAFLWDATKAKGDAADQALDALYGDETVNGGLLLGDVLLQKIADAIPPSKKDAHDFLIAGMEGFISDVQKFKQAQQTMDGASLVEGVCLAARREVINHYNLETQRQDPLISFVKQHDKEARSDLLTASFKTSVSKKTGEVTFKPLAKGEEWKDPLNGGKPVKGYLGRLEPVPPVVRALQNVINAHAANAMVLMAYLKHGEATDLANAAIYREAIDALKADPYAQNTIDKLHTAIKFIDPAKADYLHQVVIDMHFAVAQLAAKHQQSSANVELLNIAYKNYFIDLEAKTNASKVLAPKKLADEAKELFDAQREVREAATYGGAQSFIATFISVPKTVSPFKAKTAAEHAAGVVMQQCGFWGKKTSSDSIRDAQKALAGAIDEQFPRFAQYEQNVQKLILKRIHEWVETVVQLFNQNPVSVNKTVFKAQFGHGNNTLSDWLKTDVLDKNELVKEQRDIHFCVGQVYEEALKLKGTAQVKTIKTSVVQQDDMAVNIYKLLQEAASILKIGISDFNDDFEVDEPKPKNAGSGYVPLKTQKNFLTVIAEQIVDQVGKSHIGSSKAIDPKYLDDENRPAVVGRVVDAYRAKIVGEFSLYKIANAIWNGDEEKFAHTKEGRANVQATVAIMNAAFDIIAQGDEEERETILSDTDPAVIKMFMQLAIGNVKAIKEADMLGLLDAFLGGIEAASYVAVPNVSDDMKKEALDRAKLVYGARDVNWQNMSASASASSSVGR